LTVGSACAQAFARVAKINGSHGPFAALFCVGNFFGDVRDRAAFDAAMGEFLQSPFAPSAQRACALTCSTQRCRCRHSLWRPTLITRSSRHCTRKARHHPRSRACVRYPIGRPFACAGGELSPGLAYLGRAGLREVEGLRVQRQLACAGRWALTGAAHSQVVFLSGTMDAASFGAGAAAPQGGKGAHYTKHDVAAISALCSGPTVRPPTTLHPMWTRRR
jgi:hypothetical protein